MTGRAWIGGVLGTLLCIAWGSLGRDASASAQTEPPAEQTVLGPGLYAFQTRTRTASCADDERTGYVWSFVASIHGVPGSRRMQMNLVNSPYWSSWTITVAANGEISGDSYLDGSSGPSRPTSHFVVTRRDDRFTGEGTRSYDAVVAGERRRCVVTYDALLRRMDL